MLVVNINYPHRQENRPCRSKHR